MSHRDEPPRYAVFTGRDTQALPID